MACKNLCPSYIRLVDRLENAIGKSGSCHVPENGPFSEARVINYCASCSYDGKQGTGHRKKINYLAQKQFFIIPNK